MKSGTVYATRSDVERYLADRKAQRERDVDDDDQLFAWVNGDMDMTADDVGSGRLIVSEWTQKRSDTCYVAKITDRSEEDWHDAGYVAHVTHYEAGGKQTEWVPITLLGDELDSELDEEMNALVDKLRESGLDDSAIAAALHAKASDLS